MTDSTPSPAPDNLRLYLRLLRYVLPHRLAFGIAIVSLILSAATEPLFAALMKPLVDINFVNRDAARLLEVPIYIVLLFMVRGLAGFANEYSMAWLSNQVVYELRQRMFDKLLSLPAGFYDQQVAGHLMSKVLYDVSQVTQAGANLVTVSVKDSLTVAVLLGYLVYMDWMLTLVCVVTLPLISISVKSAARRLRGLSRRNQDAAGQVTQILEEAIHGQRIVKVFGGETYERQRFNGASNDLRSLNVRQTAASAGNSAFVQWIISLALAVIVYVASVRSLRGGLTAGDFVAYMTAMLMLFAPIKRLTGVNISLQKGLAAAESVFGLLDQVGEQDHGQSHIERAAGGLRFEQVSFRYASSQRDVLQCFDLDIRPGERLAVVGASGSGKTTLANLIPRLYEHSSGRILLDGVDIRQLSLGSLRHNVALVSQDIALFNDSIAANIAYGAPQATRQEIERAAGIAHVLEFTQALPEGLDTFVGDKGVRLSGGQKQRIAIARAVLKNAPVLILDEATSALDTQSERIVQEALEALMVGRTSIIIAHRLSTIKNADRIVVMQQGRGVEIGRHDELLAQGGLYARLWQMQFEHRDAAMAGEEA